MDITVWRKPCGEDKSVVLITLDPVSGQPRWSELDVNIIQDGVQYGFGEFNIVQDPEHENIDESTLVFVINDLLVRTTLLLHMLTDSFDEEAAFTMVFPNYPGAPEIEVGPFSESGDDGDDASVQIDGSFSGSWFDPDRNGEGFVIEVAETTAGTTIVVYWFTFIDGRQYWLVGQQEITPGQDTVTVPLLEFSGTGFGAEFDPNEVSGIEWGEVTFHFEGCDSATAEWHSTTGLGSGSFDLTRITQAIEGHECVE